MKNQPFVAGEIYHIFNRGVEKRRVFEKKSDYERFLYSLENFNTPVAVEKTARALYSPSNDIAEELAEVKPRPQPKLVEILAFALMPNHFHLLLRQPEDGAISKFMQKVLTGYTMYFNKKNERVGSLFQGTYKSVLIERDAQYMYIPHYIHKNPMDVLERGGKLEEYPWSSYRDYALGTKEYPFVQKQLFLEFYGGSKGYKKDFEEFTTKLAELAEV